MGLNCSELATIILKPNGVA